MLYKYGKTLGLALAILGLASTLAFAQQGPDDSHQSIGVVITVTTIDAKMDMVTLKTEAGEVFEHPKGWRWKVGDKVICDRITVAPRPRLQHCRLWQ